MHRNDLRATALVVGSFITGWTAWSGHVLLLPTAIAFPILWSLTKTRWQAATVSAVYFLAASRGLPQGVANFFAADIGLGLLLWLISSSTFVSIHAVIWTSKTDWQISIRYLIACVVMAVPPFGIVGWAHPITGAGVLLPGWGWSGLALMAAGLGIMTTHHRPAAAMAMTGLWLWSAAKWTTPILPASLSGVDLEMGAYLGREAGLERQQNLVKIVRNQMSGTTVVLPESALGFWTPTIARYWQSALAETDISVIAGAAVVDETGYDNVLVYISAEEKRILYRQRMPVPGSMWQPWLYYTGSVGARAYFSANPIVIVNSQRLVPLICYEQLLVWPVLHSALYRPDAIIAVGNGWWTSGTSIIYLQRASTEAWARLFDLPLVTSFNR
jgi:hypothetical protein